MNYYDAMQIRLQHAQNLPVNHVALQNANAYIERERRLQREQRMYAPARPPATVPAPTPLHAAEPDVIEAGDETFRTPLASIGWVLVAGASTEVLRIAAEARSSVLLTLTPIVAIDFYRSAV